MSVVPNIIFNSQPNGPKKWDSIELKCEKGPRPVTRPYVQIMHSVLHINLRCHAASSTSPMVRILRIYLMDSQNCSRYTYAQAKNCCELVNGREDLAGCLYMYLCIFHTNQKILNMFIVKHRTELWKARVKRTNKFLSNISRQLACAQPIVFKRGSCGERGGVGLKGLLIFKAIKLLKRYGLSLSLFCLKQKSDSDSLGLN